MSKAKLKKPKINLTAEELKVKNIWSEGRKKKNRLLL